MQSVARAREPREEAQRRPLHDALRLERVAHAAHDLAALRLREVEPVAEDRDERVEPRLQRLGDEDLVAGGPVRERDARERRDLLRPGARRDDHEVARRRDRGRSRTAVTRFSAVSNAGHARERARRARRAASARPA